MRIKLISSFIMIFSIKKSVYGLMNWLLILRFELVFGATVPGLQNRLYTIKKENKEYTNTRKIDLSKSGVYTIEWTMN